MARTPCYLGEAFGTAWGLTSCGGSRSAPPHKQPRFSFLRTPSARSRSGAYSQSEFAIFSSQSASCCIGEGPADLDGDAVKAGCLAIVKDRYRAGHGVTPLQSITSSGETHWLRQRAFGLDSSSSRRQPPKLNPR